MALRTYRAKRNFNVTPEPRGTVARSHRGLTYVVQKHAASHLHFDFRLELDGVLLSWAIPKGPSLDPADRRLAIHVEDHPLEYGSFEGIIPAKQYGGGTVLLWDRGSWEPEGDPSAGYRKGHLRFQLHGDKLKGRWSLIRTHGSRYDGKNGDRAWLLIKGNDAAARSGERSIVDRAPDSVESGRTLEQIANGQPRVWQSNLSAKENVRAGAVPAPRSRAPSEARASGHRLAGAKRAPLPVRLLPMLTTLVARAPSGDDWIHEVKYDGYRMLGRIERGRCRLFSRNGKEWTATLGTVAADLARLPARQAWIDGEVVALDERGRSRFQLLQQALADSAGRGLTFFAFDLPYLDGVDLRGAALVDRKQRLRALVDEGVGCVRVGPEIVGGGAEFFRQSCSLNLEGTVSKRIASVYADGARSRDWVKAKCMQRQEMVIGGFTDPQGTRSGFGALLLGVYDHGELKYAGKVGTGFNAQTLASVGQQLRALERKSSPFANPPRGYEAKGAHWVAPKLVAEVSFTEWSDDGALRHPSFQGLRLDKPATAVVREDVHEAEEPPAKRRATSHQKQKAAQTGTAELKLTHPEKLYFPEARLAKCDIVQYYLDVADAMLPHLRGRPLSLVRCPDGWKGQCFYQKHADKSVDAAVTRVEVPESGGKATYMSAESPRALAALVQWGVIELHPWGARAPHLERPDRLIFDFDPDERVKWDALVDAVTLLRSTLEQLGLQGFVKTTGGKGLHVVVPIRPTLDWTQAKGFSKAVAALLARTLPDRFTVALAKERRQGRIFIDYLRNAEGATAVAPYSVRARKNAPVATPIEWVELAHDVRYDFFNVRNVRARLAKADPWASLEKTRQTISKSMAKQLGLHW